MINFSFVYGYFRFCFWFFSSYSVFILVLQVLQVHAGEEVGPGGFPSLLEESRNRRRMRRRGRRMIIMSDGWEEEVRYVGGQPGDGGGHVGQIPLDPFCPLSPTPAALASRFFSPRRS